MYFQWSFFDLVEGGATSSASVMETAQSYTGPVI